MSNETENIISKKTWSRNMESINKIGYMDGASDGQTAVFQSSFDMGYKQGLSFGIELSSRKALLNLQMQQSSVFYQNELRDPRKINCQLCLNGIPSEQHLLNLYNTQEESNTEILKLQ